MTGERWVSALTIRRGRFYRVGRTNDWWECTSHEECKVGSTRVSGTRKYVNSSQSYPFSYSRDKSLLEYLGEGSPNDNPTKCGGEKGYVLKTKSGYYYKVEDQTGTYMANKFIVSSLSKDKDFSHLPTRKVRMPYMCSRSNTIMTREEALKEGETNMKTLFQFPHPDTKVITYGAYLATDSDGNWVMDVQGGGYIAVNKDLCKEVVPHSILVRSGKRGRHHLMADKGKFKVGELYLDDKLEVFFVEKVDTETRSNHTFEPVARINAEML